MKEFILTKDEVSGFAKSIALELQEKNILCLSGDLGSGKTFFASHVIKYLTNNQNLTVLSPTFNIVNVYNIKNQKSIYHFDLYRIKTLEELENIGFFEAISGEICIIEWWDILNGELKKFLQQGIFLNILYLDQLSRKFIYEGRI